ncbi:MAG: hypothetical protein GC166_12520 [Alphaproteobacteria bacterium]|nr:hypothetical protein [Alphaproteobacteria bacterium]
MENLIATSIIVFIAIGIYRFRHFFLLPLRRFDERNIARRNQELRDRADASAHIRHALGIAEEQVESVLEVDARDPRTGQPIKQYIFEAETYLTREEAEAVRAQKIGDIARGFYRDLPAALAERNKGKLN